MRKWGSGSNSGAHAVRAHDTKWVHRALRLLDQEAGGNVLRGLPIVVTHIKYSLTNEPAQEIIRKDLEAANDLGVRFVIPEQGALYHFR
jgi:3',5'-cyclic-nucleotide phosphodiesterase